MPSILYPTISMGRWDFTTYLPLLPLSMTREETRAPDQMCPGAPHSGWASPAVGLGKRRS
jgi:hypothetical protein